MAIVFAIERVEGQGEVELEVLRLEQPFEYANQYLPVVRQADGGAAPINPDRADLVRAEGEAVHARLCMHQGVKQIFEAEIGAKGTAAPIFVRVNSSATPAWETVYHPARRFLALDPLSRWPIARIAGTHPPDAVRVVQLPLRVAAILAPAQRSALPEWEALYSSLVKSNLDFELHVFFAEDQVVAAVNARADKRVKVAFVPDSDEEMMAALSNIGPHVLHVLAHGYVSTDPYVQIATRAGHGGNASHQIYLGADPLSRLADTLLLVVLNACRGAMSVKGVESLAYRLVCNGGVPAAIGMRDLIDTDDAVRFTNAFYGYATGQLAATLVPGQQVSFAWAEAVRVGRAALTSKHAGTPEESASTHSEWTLPILYVRNTEQMVKIAVPAAPVAPEQRVELQTERRILLAAHQRATEAEAPPPTLAVLAQRIGEIDAQLGG